MFNQCSCITSLVKEPIMSQIGKADVISEEAEEAVQKALAAAINSFLYYKLNKESCLAVPPERYL